MSQPLRPRICCSPIPAALAVPHGRRRRSAPRQFADSGLAMTDSNPLPTADNVAQIIPFTVAAELAPLRVRLIVFVVIVVPLLGVAAALSSFGDGAFRGRISTPSGHVCPDGPWDYRRLPPIVHPSLLRNFLVGKVILVVFRLDGRLGADSQVGGHAPPASPAQRYAGRPPLPATNTVGASSA